MMASSLAHLVWFLLLACSITRSETDAQPVLLSPVGNVTLCPKQYATFTCRTIGGALLWRTTGEATGRVFNDEAQASSDLGIFRLSVTGVRKEGSTVVEVNSTATTLTGVQLEDDNIILTCLIATNFTSKTATLRVADLPLAPLLTSTTPKQIDTNSSSILISWNSIDCAVQYVVTINSSDGSVYPNITTSDTNTTVTLPNGVEYCATVVAVDAIGRRGPDSVPSCYAIPDKPAPSSTIVVEVPTSTNQPLYSVSPSSLLVEHKSTIVTGTLSPTQSPVVMDGINLIAVVLPIILVTLMIPVIVLVIVIALLLFRRKKNSMKLDEKQQSPEGAVITSASSHPEQVVLNSVNNGDSELPGDSATLSNQSFTGSRNPSAASITLHASIASTSHSGSIDPDQVSRSPTLKAAAASQERSVHNPPPSSIECVCQVFYQQLDSLNNWKILIALFPKEQHIAVASDMKQYGEAYMFALDPNKNEDLLIDISEISKGWNFQHKLLTVRRTAVKQYNGDGEPPHFEMIFKAAPDNITPPDLFFSASFNGLQDSLEVLIEAQTVTDCIAQVFYHPLNKTSINCWKAKIAFFPKTVRKDVVRKRNFQDANIGQHSDKLNFSGGTISVPNDETDGWTVTTSDQQKEVSTAAMEQYDGNEEPPYIELILRAVSDDPPDLSLPIALTGVKSPNNITLDRVVVTSERVPRTFEVTSKPNETSTTYTCQVFYHRMGTNHWKATLAFFPRSKLDRVRQFYQDANFGQTTDVEFTQASWSSSHTINTKLASHYNGWKLVFSTDKKNNRSDVEHYTGAHWPPSIEVKIEPMSEGTVPYGDLKQEISLTGVTPNIVIEREHDKSDISVPDVSQTSNDWLIF